MMMVVYGYVYLQYNICMSFRIVDACMYVYGCNVCMCGI